MNAFWKKTLGIFGVGVAQAVIDANPKSVGRLQMIGPLFAESYSLGRQIETALDHGNYGLVRELSRELISKVRQMEMVP